MSHKLCYIFFKLITQKPLRHMGCIPLCDWSILNVMRLSWRFTLLKKKINFKYYRFDWILYHHHHHHPAFWQVQGIQILQWFICSLFHPDTDLCPLILVRSHYTFPFLGHFPSINVLFSFLSLIHVYLLFIYSTYLLHLSRYPHFKSLESISYFLQLSTHIILPSIQLL